LGYPSFFPNWCSIVTLLTWSSDPHPVGSFLEYLRSAPTQLVNDVLVCGSDTLRPVLVTGASPNLAFTPEPYNTRQGLSQGSTNSQSRQRRQQKNKKIVCICEGAWRGVSKLNHSPAMRATQSNRTQRRISRASMETLAVTVTQTASARLMIQTDRARPLSTHQNRGQYPRRCSYLRGTS